VSIDGFIVDASIQELARRDMSGRRTTPWLAVILLGVGLIALAIPGLWFFMRSTATVLHPKPQEVPSVAAPGSLATKVDRVTRARAAVRAHLAEKNLPGLSVAVGVGGEVVWAEGFGFADLDKKTPVTPNHRFRIGTASKVLTSAAAGLLVEQGKLKLDEPIQTYVPEFPAKQWPVTVRHLMGHTAGLHNDGGDEGPLFGQHCEKPVEALKHFAEEPLQFQPGTEYRYSNYGWILVSAAVEAADGKPFLDFLRERVFEPLVLRDTIPDPARWGAADSETLKVPPSRDVAFYFPRFAADPTYGLHALRDLELSCYSGASVFKSTPSDLVRFGMAIQDGKLLKPDTVRMMQTSQKLPSGKETGYGLGWDVENVPMNGRERRVVGHDGDVLGGMVASLLLEPEQGVVVSVVSNISYADTFSLAVKIAEVFAGDGKGSAKP
jgi:serine beta-lactamase-like protein LACTB, mitochondrial